MHEVWEIFKWYSEITLPVIALILFLANYKKIDKSQTWLLIYLIVITILLIPVIYLARHKENNLYLYHWMALIECILLVIYIEKQAYNNKKLMMVLIGSFTVFWGINLMFFESFRIFNSFSLSIESLIISFCCFRYILSLTNRDEIMYFQRLPTFWIISGFLIYHVCGFLLFLSFKYNTLFNFGHNSGRMIWGVVEVINLIKFTFISAGILWYRRQNIQD